MKIYCIKSNLIENWSSAAALSQSYYSRYKLMGDIEFVDFHQLQKITIQCDSIVIFCDYHYDFFELEKKIGCIPLNTKVLFHIYGDIFGRLKGLETSIKDLNSRAFKIVVGSKSAYNIAIKCLVDSNNLVLFPFMPNLKAIKSTKNKNNKFIYFGRISYYKNVHTLIDLFNEFSKSNPEHELHIAGEIDNFRWRNNPTGNYFNYAGEKFDLSLQKAKSEGSNIFYHGHLSQIKLKVLMSTCGVYITLSTSELEDFGLSVSEALENGLNVIATKWGGIKEFSGCRGVDLIDVSLNRKTLCVSKSKLFKLLASKESSFGVDYAQRVNEWKVQTINLNNIPTFLGFNDEFRSIRSTTKIHREFFDYGKKFVSTMWE